MGNLGECSSCLELDYFGYYNMNQITSLSYPNGLVSSKTYDPLAYYLTDINTVNNTTSTQVDDIQYTYDPMGNRTSMESNVSGAKVTISYGYDGANQLVKIGGVPTYGYDGNGNLKSQGTTQYYWDNFNRLTDLVAGVTVASYRYDAMGRRGWKTVESTGAWRYVYDGNEVVAEFNNPSATQYTLYTMGPEGVISRETSGGATVYYQYDGLGSVSKVTDPTGNIATSYSYDAFGKTTVDPENPYRFVGGPGVRTDDESGLMYMRARYYDLIVGRFISRDPIGIRGGLNLYGYVENNPINNIDPLGLLGVPGTWFYINAGESYGEEAGQYWANQYIQTGNPLDALAGGLASLWTNDTSNETTSTLTGEYLARVFGPFRPKDLPKILARLRKYFRVDSPHHGKGWEIDGDIKKWIMKYISKYGDKNGN